MGLNTKGSVGYQITYLDKDEILNYYTEDSTWSLCQTDGLLFDDVGTAVKVIKSKSFPFSEIDGFPYPKKPVTINIVPIMLGSSLYQVKVENGVINGQFTIQTK